MSLLHAALQGKVLRFIDQTGTPVNIRNTAEMLMAYQWRHTK